MIKNYSKSIFKQTSGLISRFACDSVLSEWLFSFSFFCADLYERKCHLSDQLLAGQYTVYLPTLNERYEQKNCVSLSQQLYSEQTYLVKSR